MLALTWLTGLTWFALIVACAFTTNAVRLNNKAKRNLRETKALRESARQYSDAAMEAAIRSLGRCVVLIDKGSTDKPNRYRCGLYQGHDGPHLTYGEALMRGKSVVIDDE